MSKVPKNRTFSTHYKVFSIRKCHVKNHNSVSKSKNLWNVVKKMLLYVYVILCLNNVNTSHCSDVHDLILTNTTSHQTQNELYSFLTPIIMKTKCDRKSHENDSVNARFSNQ